MKRKVLCFFSYLLMILLFFTLISPKVEEEMLTLVHTRKGSAKGKRNLPISMLAIEWPNGQNRLYGIVEGEGWEAGLRIAEIPSHYLHTPESPARKHMELGGGTEYWYVYSASREPVLGGAVREIETWKGEDTYLIWHPESLANLEIPARSMEITARGENAVLMHNWAATFPFFEHNIWHMTKESVGEELRVYSLYDIRQFAQCLPWLAGIGMVLICSLILLTASWVLFRKTDRKTIWIANIIIIGIFLLVLPQLLNRFDLPASLLPGEFIWDIPHYIETFDRITVAMNSLGDSTVQGWLSQAGIICAIVTALSLALTFGIVMAEWLGCRSGEQNLP